MRGVEGGGRREEREERREKGREEKKEEKRREKKEEKRRNEKREKTLAVEAYTCMSGELHAKGRGTNGHEDFLLSYADSTLSKPRLKG